MSAPRVIGESIGGGALARAALDGSAPAGWFLPAPRGVDEWRSHAEAVRSAFPGARWLETLRPALSPSGAAAERLERVAAGHGVVVTTGQQPGLFGGPGYTWLKAISALELANRLEREIGVPVAPVFWAATDDADFDEAASTSVSLGAEVRRIAIERQGEEGLVMAQVPTGDCSAQIAMLTDAAGSASQAGILDALRAAYHQDATVGGAYVQLLRAVLEPLGIAVLDAWHPAVRSASRPTLVEALNRAAMIDEAVALRGVSIERAGFRAQVARVPRLSLVFRSTVGVKERVPLTQAGDAARRDDLVLSANVLLRPVVERRLLPTVAYAGGAGEIAYFAQVTAVAEALGAALPLIVPRWSATVIEPAVDRMLGRLGMMFDDVKSPHAAERRIADRAMPAAVRDSLEELRKSVETRVDAVAASLGSPPLVTKEVIEGARVQLRHRVERLERRIRAAAGRGETAAMNDLAAIRAALMPGGARQERRLNYLPLLARHGDVLIEQLQAGAAIHAGGLIGSK
ncbi:MAG: bacillithiol biosynthesis cysteine-adding enzyme BshC [Gemmatimonadales bacterium]